MQDFEDISVRETEGVSIIKELTNKDVVTVLDPTMLVDALEWRNIEKIEILPKNEKYILTYFLGEQEENVKKYIDKLACDKNYQVINMMSSERGRFYSVGPEGFVTLIDHAEAVFTDSFHATVFSILFHTPFVVLKRKHRNASDMNGRLRTLLKKFELEKCMEYTAIEEAFCIDFEKCDNILKNEREKSLEYLRRTLKKLNTNNNLDF